MAESQNQFVPELLQVNLNFIEEKVLAQLPNDTYALAKGASDAIGASAEALYDNVDPNGPQIEEIWRSYVNNIVIDFAKAKAENEIIKIKSDILKGLTGVLVDPVGDTLKALTDGISDNGDQLRALWIAFLKEGQNLDILLENTLKPALLLVIKNESTVALLVGLIATQLRALIK